MTKPDCPTDRTTPLKRGADRGLLFGVYFTAIFLTWVYAREVPWLSVAAVALAVSVPVLIYKTLRRSLVADDCATSVTNLWIEGIVAIACGALLCAVVTLVFLKWVEPDFITGQLERMIELHRATGDPSLADAAEMSRRILENNAVPKASTMTVGLWLFTVSSGSIVAGLMAVLAKIGNRPQDGSGRGRRQ